MPEQKKVYINLCYMNKIIFVNLLVCLSLLLYLLFANLGFFGVSFSYQQDTYSPWRSHFWPRTNYEVLENQTIKFKQNTWLDLNLPLMFQKALVEIEGENLDNLELAWKGSVEGELLLLNAISAEGYLELDLSEISEPHYLVFILKENQEVSLSKLKISFVQPRWFYDFKKNMLE